MQDNIEEILARVAAYSVDNWSSVRDRNNFDLKLVDYPWGQREVLVPRDQEAYEYLQCSRGVPSEGRTFDEIVVLSSKSSEEPLNGIETMRFIEATGIEDDILSVYEIGFKVPRVLEFFKNIGKEVAGCDIVTLNVLAAKALGYDVEQADINSVIPSKAGLADLVLCYHVLEHTSDPFLVVKAIHATMKNGAFFHVEAPLGRADISHGHLFSFGNSDLRNMLEHAGFKIIKMTPSNRAVRYLVRKV